MTTNFRFSLTTAEARLIDKAAKLQARSAKAQLIQMALEKAREILAKTDESLPRR